jgi:hypothetical protein
MTMNSLQEQKEKQMHNITRYVVLLQSYSHYLPKYSSHVKMFQIQVAEFQIACSL